MAKFVSDLTQAYNLNKGEVDMDSTNNVLAANIQKYRKSCGFTQEELAQKLGVTFQAISKWENAKSAPDILFLPTMADLFGCSIDELFSRTVEINTKNGLCNDLPWEDDDVIRIFQAQGKKILKFQERNSLIEVEFPKTAMKPHVNILRLKSWEICTVMRV